MKLDDRKTIVSWALYDWANSAFATTVMAGFFPLFFAFLGALMTCGAIRHNILDFCVRELVNHR